MDQVLLGTTYFVIFKRLTVLLASSIFKMYTLIYSKKLHICIAPIHACNFLYVTFENRLRKASVI